MNRGVRLSSRPHSSAREEQKGSSVGGLGCGATRSAGPVRLVGPAG
jgi:hypothetical protein